MDPRAFVLKTHLSLEVWAPNMEGVLGTLKSLYRVYSRYIRIPGLRAHTRGPWFQLLNTCSDCSANEDTRQKAEKGVTVVCTGPGFVVVWKGVQVPNFSFQASRLA